VFDIEEMATELQEETAWQSTPFPVYKEDYLKLVIQAIKKFYVDVNHPDEYDRTLFIIDEHDHMFYNYYFNILQEEYIYILCKMKFFQKVATDLAGDGSISYTTDALSVTGAKEGYKSIKQIIDDLELERIRVFHKMMAHEG